MTVSLTRGLRIVSSEHLFSTIPGPQDRMSRLRRWIEDRYDRIGLPYVWPRVRRARIEPKILLVGDVLYCHPLVIDQFRRIAS